MFKVWDVAIFSNAYFADASEELKNQYTPPQDKVMFNTNLWLGELEHELAEKVMDACEPRGYNFIPTRQYAQLYSIVNESPRDSHVDHWDSEELIQSIIAISRIVHPTNFSFQYTARIRFYNKKLSEIIPGPVHGLGGLAFISKIERNWLSSQEVNILRELFEEYNKVNLYGPAQSAFWYHEYSARIYEIDIRCILVVTGLEAILNSWGSNQFIKRMPYLLKEIGMKSIAKKELQKIYKLRSNLVHGRGFMNEFGKDVSNLYLKAETVLRKTIRYCIENPKFVEFIDNPREVRIKWPLK